jgi:hypothetical protein
LARSRRQVCYYSAVWFAPFKAGEHTFPHLFLRRPNRPGWLLAARLHRRFASA